MGEHLPDAVYVPTLSTAAPPPRLEQPVDVDVRRRRLRARRRPAHGLEMLAEGIGDMRRR